MLITVHELACVLATIYLYCADCQPSNLSVGLLLTPSCSMQQQQELALQETRGFWQRKRGEPIDKKHTLAMRCASINM